MTTKANKLLDIISEGLEVKALLDVSIRIFESDLFNEFDHFEIATLLKLTKEKLQKFLDQLDCEDMKKIL